jgi:NDP-hexose-3-ketoreductase
MIRIGIICPSEIAFRRFLPALQEASDDFQFTAIGIASAEEWFGNLSKVSVDSINEQQSREQAKAQNFIDQYGGKIIVGYENLIISNDIDAVYIPLPPALHFKWTKRALYADKHVFVEKPLTTCLADTVELIRIASEKGLVLHENYMFIYHNQLEALNDVVKSGEIGEVRLYRITFGFPMRQLNDFRYNKKLGGGALLDAGGYCLKYANYLLGGDAKVITAQANNIEGFEVDIYGSATMANDKGDLAQIAFGMDNDYRCEIEIWGSKGTITSNRILTAPASFEPSYIIKKNQKFEARELPTDDAFLKSVERFKACIYDTNICTENYNLLLKQQVLVEQFKELANL